MNEGAAQFNLIDEPWIPVLAMNGQRRLVGVREALAEAGQVETLACDLPTQDFAILRLLLAIVRRAIDWVPDPQVDAAAEWAAMWEDTVLPEDVGRYLTAMHDRFWLLGGPRPFYQVPGLRYTNAERSAADLVDLIADVPNGNRLFSQRRARSWSVMAPAEAALWLLHVQAYDSAGIRSGVAGDPGVKAGKSYPSGTGWCGALGGLFVDAGDLRRTLLCNMPMSLYAPSAPDLPAWESERSPLPPARAGRQPTGPIDALTWQSRLVRLVSSDAGVTGAVLSNGDRLLPQNQMAVEYMTGWRRSTNQEKKLGLPLVFMPSAHQPERAMWRGMAALLGEPAASGGPIRQPARVIDWIAQLRVEGWLPDDLVIDLHAVGIAYGANESTVSDMISDHLDFRVQLLSGPLRHAAVAATADADQAAQAAAQLLANLHLASGGDPQAKPTARGREEAYSLLDRPYRAWLSGLGEGCEIEAARIQWQVIVHGCLTGLAAAWLGESPAQAWAGRQVGGKWVSAPLAEVWFNTAMRKALPLAVAPSGGEIDVT